MVKNVKNLIVGYFKIKKSLRYKVQYSGGFTD